MPLSARERNGIRTLPYGNHVKIGAYTPAPQHLDDAMSYYLNLDHKITGWPGQRALTLFVGGEKSLHITQETAEALVNDCVNSLQKEYPDIRPEEVVVKDWNKDPFARGSYSTLIAGADVPANFGDSPDGRLFFAGEHVARDHSGYMEGAVQSGIRAAKKLLKLSHRKEGL